MSNPDAGILGALRWAVVEATAARDICLQRDWTAEAERHERRRETLNALRDWLESWRDGELRHDGLIGRISERLEVDDG